MNAEALLGRPERAYPLPDLSGRRVIVTGHKGSLGRLLTPTIDALGGDVVGFDLPTLDVTRRSTAKAIKDYKPDNDLFPAYHIPKLQDEARTRFKKELGELRDAYAAQKATEKA